MSLDEGVSEKTSFLSHSFQQLDRIDSLSEQVGFLEERLGTCEWIKSKFKTFYCTPLVGQDKVAI